MAMEPTIGFERLSWEEGLSQNSVACIVQDRKGFMWFCTGGGLNRYDGYEFMVFRHDPDDPNSISDNVVNTLYEDADGTLWAGTMGGLNRFDPQTQTFVSYRHDVSDPHSLSNDNVMAITQDRQGALWVGTNAGLNRYDKKTDKFTRLLHQPGNENSLNSNKIRALLAERSGIIWIGTQDGGLNKMDTVSGTFEHFVTDSENPRSISHNTVVALHRDRAGRLWIGTFGGGLNRFDSVKRHFVHYRYSEDDVKSLSNDNVRILYEDKRGRLWVGTFNGGLNLFEFKHRNFERYSHVPSDPYSLSSDRVWSVLEDNSGVLWVGTFGGGINKYDTKFEWFGHIRKRPMNEFGLNDKKVHAIYEEDGMILVGTDSGGLNHYDPKTGKFSHFKYDSEVPDGIQSSRVNAIYKDRQGRIWLGTVNGLHQYFPIEKRFKHYPLSQEALSADELMVSEIRAIYQDHEDNIWIGTFGSGLWLFDPQTGEFEMFRHSVDDPDSLSNDQVNVIFQDSQNLIWIGTNGGGLELMVGKGEKFVHYRHDKDNTDSLSHNAVLSIMEDAHGVLWIGTYGGGLNKFENGMFTRYHVKDGLSNDTVHGVLQDKTGAIWLSTNQGLSKFHPYSGIFTNYEVAYGAQGNEFNSGAYFRSAKGELFFGGLDGFYRFYGENIQEDRRKPQVALTEFMLFNQSVPVRQQMTDSLDENFKLPAVINALDELTLTYKESFFSFGFAAMDFAFPMKNLYAYKMEGWDSDWIYTDAKNRRATYTNLPPGDYTFRVKAANKDGYWNHQGRTLKVIVSPPPWETWWAYGAYATILLAVVVLFVSVYTERKKRMAEHEVNLQLKQVDKMKDEFLANTSHELRTPLNGIIGLAESLIDGATGQLPDKTLSNLAMVVASGKRLANLVNDILDFSKLKERSIELHTKPTDIRAMVEVVLTLSNPLAVDKSLELINQVPADLPPVEADEDRLQQVLHNLVGNGIKFTEKGSVTISVEMAEDKLKISVTDTGIGIAKQEFTNIFESFEQVESSTERTFSGTGLGLAVSKQLVELHGGKIEVKSKVDEGSTFAFTLPISTKPMQVDSALGRSLARLHHTSLEHLQTVQTSTGDSRFKVLIVDDEPINRQVLHNHLALQNYQLLEASDGMEALEIMEREQVVDLILLDIMMPGMSGYEVCKQLRKVYPVNDLPIIFLTAKNQVADLVQSFAVGANDYLSKPVTKHELLTRVETHLKLLDINRNLEHMVDERTADLAHKKQELELKNEEILATQHQLVQSEKMASLGTLTAGVAHEINNPTNFVHVSAQNLEVDLARFQQFIFDLAGEQADDEILQSFREQFNPLYEHLETIKDGTQRIKIIVQDLRAFTQLDIIDKKAVDISDCLRSTINLVQTKYLEVAEFITDFEPAPQLSCYAAQLNQVFMNLFVNACDAIKDKQQSADKKTVGKIIVTCKGIPGAIEVTVEDNGCGMSDTTKTKLFEPFYTTKTVGEGTGLGLSISYGIVKKHNGELTVESTLGAGSKFSLILPIDLET